MPYKSLSDLPEQVKDHLPEQGQKIYRAAYNSAWNEYDKPEKRDGNAGREEVAHKVAWAAVKQKYEKHNDKWQLKSADS